jgi:hypothetical protein
LPGGRRDWVELVLAGGLVLALNLIVSAVLAVALLTGRELSQGTAEFLMAAFGGVCGVLGSYIGFRVGTRRRRGDDDRDG